MIGRNLLLALSALGVASAQVYGNSKSSSTKKAAAPATTAASSGGAVQTIQVGKSGLTYTPDSITAKVGDQIEFQFDSAGHSVAEGTFGKPCQPDGDSAFWSGFPKPGGNPFTITVNSTDPMWFYCAQVGHCQAGMVGVINPP
jgi:plastocyanin